MLRTITHPTAALPAARTRAWIVLLISGLVGFRLGFAVYPNWQTSVENAQVIARLVHYPAATPASLVFAGEWSLVNQLLATLLRLGFSESALSRFVSGLLGMVSLQALAMLAFALCRRASVALLATLVVCIAGMTGFGATFPLLLMGTHTVETIGLPFAVLALALIGSGSYRLGGFLLGVAPAIHLPWGIALLVPSVTVILWRQLNDRTPILSSTLSAIGLGLAVTAVSLGLQTAFIAPLPALHASGDFTLERYVELWDPARAAVPPFADAVYLTGGLLVLSAIYLIAFSDGLSSGARLTLQVLSLLAAASLALALVTWAPPESVPAVLLWLAPGRFVNIGAMAFVATLFGLIGMYTDRRWGTALMLVSALALVFGPRSLFWPWRGASAPPDWIGVLNPWLILQLTAVALIAWSLREATIAPSAGGRGTTLGGALVATVTLVLIAWAMTMRPIAPAHFADRLNDPVFGTAARGEGVLLSSAPLQLVQLRTRRPVLLDRSLAAFPSILGSSNQVSDVMKAVFDVDPLNPPPEALHTAAIPAAFNKQVWEQFPVERWQDIRRLFDVRHVLTHADWSLALPVEAQSGELRLYLIPD